MDKFNELQSRFEALYEEFKAYKELTKQVLKVGDKIKIANYEWILLEKVPKGYLAIACEPAIIDTFGISNNWRTSRIREHLNTVVVPEIENAIGTKLIYMVRDLIALDGTNEYGSCADKISLLTIDEYRQYRRYIPVTGAAWWTVTPNSSGESDTLWVKVVAANGIVSSGTCSHPRYAYPVCCFPKEIFTVLARKEETV